jgi:hypothetical protein
LDLWQDGNRDAIGIAAWGRADSVLSMAGHARDFWPKDHRLLNRWAGQPALMSEGSLHMRTVVSVALLAIAGCCAQAPIPQVSEECAAWHPARIEIIEVMLRSAMLEGRSLTETCSGVAIWCESDGDQSCVSCTRAIIADLYGMPCDTCP